MRRTAKRRQSTDQLLDSIEADGLPLLSSLPSTSMQSHDHLVPSLQIPDSSSIQWEEIDPVLDPVQGGKIRRGTERGLRKRDQVDAFYFITSSIIEAEERTQSKQNSSEGITIIDAGCGAGNLGIALAGLFSAQHPNRDVNLLAVDVNNQALRRLDQRSQSIQLPSNTLQTCCADLANYKHIASQIPSNRKVIVVSLHACGAASDMAMNLAFQCNDAPFVICPCCTAKSLTKRENRSSGDNKVDMAASFRRSGSTADIEYPRSCWLRSKLQPTSMTDQYTLLAKVADVGLGPQTPTQQRLAQTRAKQIVELDRLMSASESSGYDVRLMRMQHHDPCVYGKGELLLGAKLGSVAARVLMELPCRRERRAF